MGKEAIKIVLMITIIACYFVNLLVMFCVNPINILIANLIIWGVMIASSLGLAFIEWLND